MHLPFFRLVQLLLCQKMSIFLGVKKSPSPAHIVFFRVVVVISPTSILITFT